jgi:hypothetical protein
VFSSQRRGIANQFAPKGRLELPSSVLLAQSNARFETNVSGLTCVSRSDTTQKLERQRVDGNEQRLHRSVELLILAKSTRSRFMPDRQQPRISRSPWSGTRGKRNSIADLSEVRYTGKRYRSVLPAQNPRSTLSNKTEGSLVKIAQFEGCGLVVEDDIEEGAVDV